MMNGPSYENAHIGEGTIVEPGATVGFRYHRDCGKTVIGAGGIVRSGTIVYGDVIAGDYFQTGHHAVIRAQVRFGDYCCIFNHTTVEGIVRMGRGVRIMAHVYIPTRTWFGDCVFVGPGVVFLNDKMAARYGAFGTQRIRGAFVEDNVSIGGGAVILPEVRIGEGSFVAAGALVTKDVPPRTLVRGVPGRFEPLPAKLRGENSPEVCIQPLDIWHPETPTLDPFQWPDEWPESFDEGSEETQK
jgi:acetyltransferase-like isoleucine patch superfamily enzyme